MNSFPLVPLKQQLVTHCIDAQLKRVEHAKKAMDEAQQSANNEGRSTAGDKYDTARAMSQNVRDMNAKQMQEALKDLASLQQINAAVMSIDVRMGSVVKTDAGNYFISVSIGSIPVEGQVYIAISPLAPLAQAMLHKKKGESFNFRGKQSVITEVL
jgi:transcription elongation GreA/GreB family factor